MELSNIKTWLHVNKLSLNILQTQYMILSSSRKSTPDLPITIEGNSINRVFSAKFVGVQIDPHLTWRNHTDYI